MSLGEAIYAACLAHAPLTALVGTRVYPLAAPTDVDGPHVIWQVVSASPATTLKGSAGSAIVSVQFAAFASKRMEAVAVRDAIIEALDGVILSNGDQGSLDDMREDYDHGSRLYRADADISF